MTNRLPQEPIVAYGWPQCGGRGLHMVTNEGPGVPASQCRCHAAAEHRRSDIDIDMANTAQIIQLDPYR